jgi:hypothetical protein
MRAIHVDGCVASSPACRVQELRDRVGRTGAQISRHYANHEDNFLSFTGLGGILFFGAMQLSELALEKLAAIHKSSHPPSSGPEDTTTHNSGYPSVAARIDRIKSLAVSLTPSDQRQQVAAFLEEYDLIASYLVNFVKNIFGTLGS